MNEEKRQQYSNRLHDRARRRGEALDREREGFGATRRPLEEGGELRGIGLGSCVASTCCDAAEAPLLGLDGVVDRCCYCNDDYGVDDDVYVIYNSSGYFRISLSLL